MLQTPAISTSRPCYASVPWHFRNPGGTSSVVQSDLISFQHLHRCFVRNAILQIPASSVYELWGRCSGGATLNSDCGKFRAPALGRTQDSDGLDDPAVIFRSAPPTTIFEADLIDSTHHPFTDSNAATMDLEKLKKQVQPDLAPLQSPRLTRAILGCSSRCG